MKTRIPLLRKYNHGVYCEYWEEPEEVKLPLKWRLVFFLVFGLVVGISVVPPVWGWINP